MPIYKQITEITNIDDIWTGIDRDIVEIYFGETNVYTVWQTYEGTLPATIISTGDNLRQYQIYGNTGGVGDRTVNILNFEDVADNMNLDTTTGLPKEYNGRVATQSQIDVSSYDAVTIFFEGVQDVGTLRAILSTFTANDELISRVPNIESGRVVNTSNVAYMYICIYQADLQNIYKSDILNAMLTPGTTPPENYVPFGYEVDMRVGSWSPYATHPGTLIDMTTGGENSSPQYSTAYFNNFFPSTAIITVKADTAGGGRTLRYMPYDENQAPMLDYKAEVQFVRDGREVQQAVTIPSSAAYYGVSYHNGDTQKKISTTTPIYIGDEPLDKDEYVDYQAGKVFRRTENFFDKDTAIPDKQYDNSGNLISPTEPGTWYASGLIEVEAGETYVRCMAGETVGNVVNFYKSDKTFLSRSKPGTGIPFVIPNTAKYITFAIKDDTAPIENYMLINGSAAPLAYIPYLQPTDPPAPLPALPTCEGATIVDYAGSETAPEKVLLKYRKENF